jgi:hypothetical protein
LKRRHEKVRVKTQPRFILRPKEHRQQVKLPTKTSQQQAGVQTKTREFWTTTKAAEHYIEARV